MTPTETPLDTPLDTTIDSSNAVQDEALATTEQGALEHSHDGHDHDGHEHHHHAAPTLNPELTRSIEVEASVEDVAKAFQQVTKRYTKLARIPGFRAGKVPPSLIKSRFAKEVRQEVLESLVSDRFRKALQEQTIQPVSQPQISELLLAEGAPLKFKATFEVLPEINIDGYDAVKVERPDAKLEEGEFDVELANVLDHHATVEPVEEDRAITDGDWAEIGFTGHLQELAQACRRRWSGEQERVAADYGRGCADRDRRQEHAAGLQ